MKSRPNRLAKATSAEMNLRSVNFAQQNRTRRENKY